MRLGSSGLNATSDGSLVVIETCEAFVARPMRINGSAGRRKRIGSADAVPEKTKTVAAKILKALKNINLNDSPKRRFASRLRSSVFLSGPIANPKKEKAAHRAFII